MIKQTPIKMLLAILLVSLLSYGCAQDTTSSGQQSKPAAAQAQKQKENVFTGPIVGKSNKAKTISISVGKGDDAKTVMLRFDDKTTGLEHAEKGEAAIISWEQRGDDKFALSVKPKLAKLPEGVSEIKVDELYQLISAKTPMTLVDARPESRFAQAHLPGSMNIPVDQLQEKKATVLPEDKNKLLIFYCGGYT